MINKLGLPLFVIGIFLILLSLSKNLQTNIKSTQSVKLSSGLESQALITKIVDGDTVDVEIDGKKDVVRLIGINAPETGECFGRESANKARAILNSKVVVLEADPSQDDRDKYNRILRYIFLSDKSNFGELMINNGFAKEYTYFNSPYKYQSFFKNAEKEARGNNRGLWEACK